MALWERLDRGAVAVPAGKATLVSWRSLPSDPPNLAFDVFRDGQKVNVAPLTGATCFLDKGRGRRYQVRANGKTERALVTDKPYLSIPLRPLKGYTANDGSPGDLDGDGQLELVIHRTGRTKDNSQKGETDPPILEAYRLDGKFLWRIDLGRNVRDGAHYTQFMVADLDGDGRAEVACRTADGTRDGRSRTIGDPKADWRNADGYVLKGPEYLTVFDGRTGAALDTAPYWPPRHPQKADPTPEELNAVWGDGYGNRVDRFLAGVAYLDGQRPSLVFTRGYYTRFAAAAWDFRGGKLARRWTFDSDDGHPEYRGQGDHTLAIADVDGDGKDEIVYGACALDDDGKPLYSTGLGHGDALHVSDLDPTRPGLEVFNIHEHSKTQTGVTFRDARTGEVLWKKTSPDVGRGVALDIDPRHPGAECWSSTVDADDGVWDTKGNTISKKKPRSCNFGVFWDGDGLSEILDKNLIAKWEWRTESETTLLTAEGCDSNNGTKATPVLCGDILGDWREEVVWRSLDGKELRVYATPIPTVHRLTTLLADRQYRESLATQNVGYNMPPHASFWLSGVLRARPKPTLWIVGDSTVRNGSGTGGGGQWGWGEPLAERFDPERIDVRNRAIGGRSSRTFLTEGRWDAILREAKPGDYVLMQFGHNDPGAINDDSRARGTLKGIGEETEEIDNLLTKKHETVHTYGWYMRRYVRDAKAGGMTPIVLSYVPRGPRATDPLRPAPSAEWTSYRLWARQVAEQEKATFIDLYGLIWPEYAKLTPEEVKARYFTEADLTHTNRAGAELNADRLVEGLRGTPLSKYLVPTGGG